MNWFQKLNKKTLLILSSGLLFIPILAFIFWAFGIIFTYTGSIPIGFYRIALNADSIRQGDYVSFCLPNVITRMGLSRGYLKPGSCTKGSEELIKEVIAIPGDQVTVTNQKIQVWHRGYALDYSTPTQVIDKNHLPVYRFIKNGTYIAQGYWMYGFGNPRYSWDSRYYGEVKKANIEHRLVPFWIL